MNIGAGRVVYQDLLRIDRAVASGELGQEQVLVDALAASKKAGVRLHLMGLVSRGGVHSQQAHLHALVDEVTRAGVEDCVIHAFTDGRDTAPNMGTTYLGIWRPTWRAATCALPRCTGVISPWTGTNAGSALPGATRR